MKKTVTTTILVAIGLLIALFGQNSGGKTFLQLYREADRLYNLDQPTLQTDSTALALFLKTAADQETDHLTAVNALIKAGNIHQGYQRYTAANAIYHQALATNRLHLNKLAIQYEACLYLGSSLYFGNIIDSAQYYFEEASAIAFSYPEGERLPELDRLYNSLGAIYYESANYVQAKNYFERALQFSGKSDDDYEEIFTGVQSNIANCLMRLNHYDSALRIFKSLQPNEQQRNIISQNTAHSFFELGMYDSALAIYRSLPLQNSFSSVIALTDMGRIYMNRKQWLKAERVFDSAIAHNKSFSAGIKNKEEALAYMYRSQLAEEQGLPDEAITWINEALQEVHLSFLWKNITDLPAEVAHTVSPITLFHILHAKGRLLFKKYNHSKQANLLSGSLAAYRKAIETAHFIKLNFDNDEAKLFFNENNRRIYQEAIAVAYEATRLDHKYGNDYLFIIENYKGSILYQNLRSVQLKSNAQVPDSIRSREKDIKQLLAFYTSRMNQSAEQKDANQMQQRLLSLQVELSRLQKSYERDISYNLYKFQQTENKSTIDAVQKTIDNNTALINYYYADSIIYCFVVTANDFTLKKISIDTDFHRSFAMFVDEVYHHREGKRYEGYEPAAKLYHYLLKPVEDVAGGYENWVIIPDNILYYLPFNALVKNEDKRDYLLLSRAVSYHYSMALLLEKNTHHEAEPSSSGILAFAPFISPDTAFSTDLPGLPFSAEELRVAAKHIYAGNAATKENFLQLTTQHSIIHLATHASVGEDSSRSWIQFYEQDSADINNKLFVHEIYNLDLHQAELVILSACETGGGISAAGEGLLSLSRAFLYAGADGVVSTLWKTDDRVTAFVMQRMHNYLAKNISPGKALQLARIDLLQNDSIGAQYKTPNYWANFIYMGKLPAAKKNSHHWIWWMAVLTGMAATATIVIVSKSRN